MGNSWKTGLLWKNDRTSALDRRAIARNRLMSLERKLDRDEEYAALYNKEMDHLIESGYAFNSTPIVSY